MKKTQKERINLLSDDLKRDIENIWKEKYQLIKIKRQRKYPEIGDVFLVNPKPGLYFWGVVLNNHITSMQGEDLLVAIIFSEKLHSIKNQKYIINLDKILLDPFIVDAYYWKSGLFFTIKNENITDLKINYGFYDKYKRVYCDEYANKLEFKPDIYDDYCIKTTTGVARYIQRELIIDKSLAECDETL